MPLTFFTAAKSETADSSDLSSGVTNTGGGDDFHLCGKIHPSFASAAEMNSAVESDKSGNPSDSIHASK